MEHANPHSGTDILLKALADSYSCYYTAGNHEYYAQETAQIKKRIASYGICVLAGEQQSLAVNGQQLIISGIDDYSVGSEKWLDQLTAVSQPNAAVFSVLLSHRPELIKAYQNAGFDLILSGHAHGGQWRFPFLKNGLLPRQGLFPKYTGGPSTDWKYYVNCQRGLARNIFPLQQST